MFDLKKTLKRKIKLNKGEEIILVVRKYWISIVFKLFIGSILLITPIIFVSPLFAKGVIGKSIFFVVLLFGALLILKVLWVWLNDVFVVTNKRIIDINRRSMFDQIVSQAELSKVEDTSYRQKGMCQTLFKYGHIYIQTEGEVLVLEITDIKDPQMVLSKINDHVKEDLVDEKAISLKKLKNIVDFTDWDDESVIELLDKVLAEIGEDRFAKNIAEFIDLDES